MKNSLNLFKLYNYSNINIILALSVITSQFLYYKNSKLYGNHLQLILTIKFFYC